MSDESERLAVIEAKLDMLIDDFEHHKDDDNKNFNKLAKALEKNSHRLTRTETIIMVTGAVITIVIPVIIKFLS